MRTVQHPFSRGPFLGLAGQLVVLAVLDGAVGLSAAAWASGVVCGSATAVVLGSALARRGRGGLGPADRVTLVRAMLVGGVAALVAETARGTRPALVPTLVTCATVALILDGLDGLVARWTATASGLGARFDMEVDALLIGVLSLHVAGSAGPWVLLIGAARYLRLLACLPWPFHASTATAGTRAVAGSVPHR